MTDQLLKSSASKIHQLHLEILSYAQCTLGRAVTVGELLSQVKTALNHGEWLPWLKTNLPSMSEATVKRYIRCHENRDTLLNLKVSDVSEAYEIMTTTKSIKLTDLKPETPTKVAKTPTDTSADVHELVAEKKAENRTITANSAAVANKSEPAVVRDALGCAIPDCCLPLWDRAQEVQGLMTTVSRVKGVIEKAHAEDDPMYRIVPQAVLDHLSRTYQFLTDAKPYAVCVFCQGKNNRESCRPCRGTGLVSKYGYEVRADKKLVALREMAIKKEQESNALT